MRIIAKWEHSSWGDKIGYTDKFTLTAPGQIVNVVGFLRDRPHADDILLAEMRSSIAVFKDKVYAASDLVRRWSIYKPKEPEVVFKGTDAYVTALDVAQVNGRRMVFAGTYNHQGFNKVYVWHDDTPDQPWKEFEKGVDGTGTLAYAAISGGHYIVVGSANQLGYKTREGDVCVFDLDTGLVSRLPGLRGVNVNGIATVSGIRALVVIPAT